MQSVSAALLSGIAIPKSRAGNRDYLTFKRKQTKTTLDFSSTMEIFLFWPIVLVLKVVSVLGALSMKVIQLMLK